MSIFTYMRQCSPKAAVVAAARDVCCTGDRRELAGSRGSKNAVAFVCHAFAAQPHRKVGRPVAAAGNETVVNALARDRPSRYRRQAVRRREPALCSSRQHRDAALLPEIERVLENNMLVYGVGKVCCQLRRDRFTVERLMRRRSLRGAIRGKRVCTTAPDAKALQIPERVNRRFRIERPNKPWASDFAKVSTRQGFVHIAERRRQSRCPNRWRSSPRRVN